MTKWIKLQLFFLKEKSSTQYKIHDEDNKCKMGDIVTIAEVRPISKDKSWKLIDILGSKEN